MRPDRVIRVYCQKKRGRLTPVRYLGGGWAVCSCGKRLRVVW